MPILGHLHFLGALRATVFWIYYENTKFSSARCARRILLMRHNPTKFLGQSWDLGRAESEGYKGGGGDMGSANPGKSIEGGGWDVRINF